MAKHKHNMSACRACGGAPKLEYNLNAWVRVRCTGCDAHTAYAPTRWQVYEDWEEMNR